MSTNQIEQMMDDLGIAYRERAVDVEMIDIVASAAIGQVRDERVDSQVVARYAREMSAGAVFPPIVVHANGNRDSFLLDDGFHRTPAAVIASRAQLAAYEMIDPTPFQLREFRRRCNAMHGVPLTEQERIRNAVDAIVNDGVSVPDAAALTNADVTKVKAAANDRRARERLASLAPKALALPQKARMRLGNVKSNDVMKEAALAALSTAATAEDVSELVTLINAERETSAQKAAIRTWKDGRSDRVKVSAGGNLPVPGRARKYRQAMGMLRGAMEGTEMSAWAEKALTRDARRTWAREADDAAALLRGWAKRLRAQQ